MVKSKVSSALLHPRIFFSIPSTAPCSCMQPRAFKYNLRIIFLHHKEVEIAVRSARTGSQLRSYAGSACTRRVHWPPNSFELHTGLSFQSRVITETVLPSTVSHNAYDLKRSTVIVSAGVVFPSAIVPFSLGLVTYVCTRQCYRIHGWHQLKNKVDYFTSVRLLATIRVCI